MSGFVLLLLCVTARVAQAQAPYVLPYKMTTLMGPHAPYTIGKYCSGTSGPIAYNVSGDGCPASLLYVGTEPHDVRVDSLGNVYYLDDTSTTNITIHKYNPRTGLVTNYAGGSLGKCSSGDKYGAGCPASDNLGNNATGYSYSLRGRGIGLAPNNDLYLAGYNGYYDWRVGFASDIFSVVAGISSTGYTDNVIATSGATGQTRGIGADAAGNVYIADTSNNALRKVSAANGFISTVAGSGGVSGQANTAGYLDGPAATSLISGPEDAQVDSYGNVYIADQGNSLVRVLYNGQGTIPNVASPVAGHVYTVAGFNATNPNGPSVATTYANVPQPALATAIAGVRKLTLDQYNNVYIADSTNYVVWFLDHATGYIRIIAGTFGKNGSGTNTGAGCTGGTTIGDGCIATNATLYPTSDMGVTVDRFENIYITDYEGGGSNGRIREAVNNQNFGAVATGSSPQQIIEVHVGVGDTILATTGAIINSTNTDFTIVGTPVWVNGAANADGTSDYLITVQFAPTKPGINNAALKVTTTLGQAASFGLTGIGTAPSVAIDPGAVTVLSAAATPVNKPTSVFSDAMGNTYIADTGNNRVLFYNASTATYTVIAGTGTAGYAGDGGAGTAATLKAPQAVTVDAAKNVFIADTGNNAIRRVDGGTGIITTYAGGTSTACPVSTDALGDGCPATQAVLTAPAGVAIDNIGNLYVSDQSAPGGVAANTIRVVGSNSYIYALAGGASTVCSAATDTFGDGCTASAVMLNAPAGLALDTTSNLYIADSGNNIVRMLNLGTQAVTLVAGNGQAGYAVSSGSVAALSQLNAPRAVAVDAGGNVYIADTGNHSIRLVTVTTGLISTITGINGASGTGVVPGSGVQAQLVSPAGVATTGAGTLVISDTGNSRLLSDNRTQAAYNFGRTNVGSSSTAIPFSELGTGNATASLGATLFTTTTTTGYPNYYTLTASGSNGCGNNTTLAPGATCGLTAQFSPTASTDPVSVSTTYAEAAAVVSNPAVPQIKLSGVGVVLVKTSSVVLQTAPVLPANPQYGGTLTMTATITPASCAALATICAPTGTVAFVVDGTALAPVALAPNTGNATSSAAVTISGLAVGVHTVAVLYSGDLYYASNTSNAVNVTVITATTSTLLSISPASSQQFTATTFTATVASTITGGGTPTGTVTFYNNSVTPAAVLGTGTLNGSGVGSFTEQLILNTDGTQGSNTTQVPGSYSVTAKYNGDANFSVSTSSTSTLTVTADTPAILLASRSCNEINVALASGVSAAVNPLGICPNDVTQKWGPQSSNTLYGGVAKPTSGGTAGGTITGFTLCPAPLGSPCPSTSNPDPSQYNFLTMVTFAEPNNFTVGQTVVVSGATNVNPSSTGVNVNSAVVFNIQYTVLAATSTSWTGTLTSYAATAQGASIDATLFVRPTNSLSGTMTFSCTGLPANAACTFSPTTLTLTAGTSIPAYTPVIVTFFTDLQPGTGGTSSLRAPVLAGHRSSGMALAMLFGWPITLAGLAGVIRFRRRNGFGRGLTLVALLCILVGASTVFTGCSPSGPGSYVANLTPAGTYPITITATDGSVSSSIVINFAVSSPGITGQE